MVWRSHGLLVTVSKAISTESRLPDVYPQKKKKPADASQLTRVSQRSNTTHQYTFTDALLFAAEALEADECTTY